MKDFLSSPGWGLKFFNSLRAEEDAPFYTYNDNYMRWFVRQSIKRGQVCASNQYYKSASCDDNSKVIPEVLNVNGNKYDILGTYSTYKKKPPKII